MPQNWAEVEYAFGNVKLSYDKLQNAYTEVIIMEHDPGLEAAASSTSYGEAVKAKLEGLSAEEVKQLPLGHGARDYQRWWNTMGVLDDKEDTILVMDGHRIVVPLDARKSILTLLHVPHMATSRSV